MADGSYLGPNVGASLDPRASVFVVGIEVRYRALFSLDCADTLDRIDQHLVTAGAHIGFGFY